MLRVAIVGSRDYAPHHHVYSLVRSRLPAACTVVTGGARGVDTWAENAANKRQDFPPPRIFLPSKAIYPPTQAYFVRNQQIVDFADVLIAFWDGHSTGTRDVFKRARKKFDGLCRLWCVQPHSYQWWAPAIQVTLQQYVDWGLPERRLLNAAP